MRQKSGRRASDVLMVGVVVMWCCGEGWRCSICPDIGVVNKLWTCRDCEGGRRGLYLVSHGREIIKGCDHYYFAVSCSWEVSCS